MNVHKKIRDLRKRMNYSQQLFSDKIGVSRSVLSQIEINKLKPSIEIVARIAKEFNISVSYFFEENLDENTKGIENLIVEESLPEYYTNECKVCNQLYIVNDIQKDVIHSLEKTISTQFQVVELLEKKLNELSEKNNEKQQEQKKLLT